MPLSVTRPVGLALDRTKRVCFQPFEAGKWFTLGFCAFLAMLGEGGAGSGFQYRKGGRPPWGGNLTSARHWFHANLDWLIPVGALVLIIGIGLTLLFTWLHCRGKFMFIDGVVRNRGAVVVPWHALRRPANRLFRVYIVLTLIGLGFSALVGGICLAVAWPDMAAGRFSDQAGIALGLGLVLFIPFAIAMAVVQFVIRDFVVPTMYLHGEGFRTAWATVRREVLAGHGWTIFLYMLMKFVLGMAIAIVAIVVMLLTCCIAMLPYIGTVILLPLWVFAQAYPLYFLEQIGPGWRFFPDDPAGPFCRTCGYNLHGNVSGVCPECGTPPYPAAGPPPTAPF